MNIEWQWIPNTRLGPIVLGSDVSQYEVELSAVLEESDDATEWETYVLPGGDVYIDAEGGVVVSVTSFGIFLYKGNNLIGLNLVELGGLVGVKPDEIGEGVEYEDGDVRVPYEYFDLGLQVWTSGNAIVSISCLTYED